MNTKRRSPLVITAHVSSPSGPGLGIRMRKIGKIQWLPLLPHFLTKLGEPLTSEKKDWLGQKGDPLKRVTLFRW